MSTDRIEPLHVTETEKSSCPNCGHGAELASAMEGEHAPEPQDAAVCFGCGDVNVYDGSMRLRSMTDDERASLTPEQRAQIHEARVLISQAKARGRRTP